MSVPTPDVVATPADNAEASDDGPPTPNSVLDDDATEAFSNLRDERHFEETKRAKLVMGPPLGGEGAGKSNETVIPGQELAENEAILQAFPDEAEDLELTHMRIRTLRGLGIERFRAVERISLRQNLLSSLSYVPLPPTAPQDAGHTLNGAEEVKDVVPAAGGPTDEVDEDEGDDEDAKKKEEEFEWSEHHTSPSAEVIWPLRGLEKLEELDLYDNRLKSVKGLEGLVAIKSLDLSFNLIRSIRDLDDESPDSPFAYPQLDHLYLIQNKLSKIEGVRHRTGLDYLELGGNRIRTIENLPISATLRSLYLGKNKITKMEGLEGLTGLRTLSIQSNRITKIEGLDSLVALEELYLSHNGLTELGGLEKNVNLTTLDIANNKIQKVDLNALSSLTLLEEFWANNNEIDHLPILSPSTHPALETLYLEGNPIEKMLATAYRRKIHLEMPQLKQIDAVFVKQS
ncbi:protein phosphatase 1 regulatory subunit 7, partial [Phenoliferia sp. Uapishka_3]